MTALSRLCAMPRALASGAVALGRIAVVRPLCGLYGACARGCAWWWDVDGAHFADDYDDDDDKDGLLFELGDDRSDTTDSDDSGCGDRVSYLDLHRRYTRGDDAHAGDPFAADIGKSVGSGGGSDIVEPGASPMDDERDDVRPEVLAHDEEPDVGYRPGDVRTVYRI